MNKYVAIHALNENEWQGPQDFELILTCITFSCCHNSNMVGCQKTMSKENTPVLGKCIPIFKMIAAWTKLCITQPRLKPVHRHSSHAV